MNRSFVLALTAAVCACALTSVAADPAEKMAGTWVGNADPKTKEVVTLKLEDGKWSVSGVFKVDDKEVGSYKADDLKALKDGTLVFKKAYEKKPNAALKDGELFTAAMDKDQLVISHKAGKNKATVRYTSAEVAKVDPKADPKAEVKGERRVKPEDVLAKPGDTVRFVVVRADKAGISEKHVDALKKGKLTKLECSFAGFEEDEQRLVVSDVSEQPKELELAKGTYRMAVVGRGALKGLEVPNVPASMYFAAVKLPGQFYLEDIKYVGEAKGKFKLRTAEPAEGSLHVIEAKVVKFGK